MTERGACWWYSHTDNSPPDWPHFFNWTGAGVLGTCVQKIFRYHWSRTGATTSHAALCPTGKIEHALLWKCVTHQILYREISFRGVAPLPKTGLAPVLLTVNSHTQTGATFPYREFRFAKFPMCQSSFRSGATSPKGKFCIRKFPIEGSGATSKTGLALGFCGDSFSTSPWGGEFTVGGTH